MRRRGRRLVRLLPLCRAAAQGELTWRHGGAGVAGASCLGEAVCPLVAPGQPGDCCHGPACVVIPQGLQHRPDLLRARLAVGREGVVHHKGIRQHMDRKGGLILATQQRTCDGCQNQRRSHIVQQGKGLGREGRVGDTPLAIGSSARHGAPSQAVQHPATGSLRCRHEEGSKSRLRCGRAERDRRGIREKDKMARAKSRE